MSLERTRSTTYSLHYHDSIDLAPAVSRASRARSHDPPSHQLHASPSRQIDQRHDTTVVSEPVDINGGIGWLYVACTFVFNACTWGLFATFSVFLNYYLTTDVFPNATFLDYAFIGGISIGVGLLVAPLATWCTTVLGTRATLVLGVVFETVSLIGASFASQIWQLFLSQGLCLALGLGLLFSASAGLVAQWFTTQRSLANGLATAGSGIGSMALSLAVGAMIPSIGLPWTFRVLAIVVFVVMMIAALLVRDRNKAIGASMAPFDHRLLRRPEYLCFLAWSFVSLLGYLVLLFSLGNYATTIGLTPHESSVVVAIFNLGQGLGRPLMGLFSDRVGRINLATGLTFLCSLFCFVIWTFARSYGVLIFFALIMGMPAGVFWATAVPVGAEVVGLQQLPAALSILWVVTAFPSAFSEAIGLELRAATGSYLVPQLWAGATYFLAGVFLWVLRAWKIGQLEQNMPTVPASEADLATPKTSKASRSSLLRRLVMYRKV